MVECFAARDITMNEPSTAADLLQQIRDSRGSAYLNRTHQRSFSLNVFQMNAVELMEAAHRVKDPEQGMALMLDKNSEAGRQAHRELNRHVHNFVSSALALVEHTRVFMRNHYAGTDLMATYEKQVAATFMQSPVAQFIQGLRNYMLHRGLPKSSMFMKFTSNPGATDGSGKAETGVHYDAASLLDWDGWKPMARTYLAQVGKKLDLHEVAQDYLTLVNQFHVWLDVALGEYHQSDIEELSQLQAQFEAIRSTKPETPAVSIEPPELVSTQPFEFNSMQTTRLSQISSNLLGKIREVSVQQSGHDFPTERPTTTITDRELIGPITFWGQEASGETVFGFIRHQGKAYGLSEDDYGRLDGLIDNVMELAWARAALSREFVERIFCNWARQQFCADGASFPEALSTAARESVTEVEVWAPIANMEVERSFDFGPVRIESITASVIANLRSKAPSNRPEQEQQIRQLIDSLRQEFQGCAAVVVSMKAEPATAKERALRIAQDAVDLLRFFSPAAPRSYLFSPVALAGASCVPTSKLIVMRESGFIHSQGLLPKHVGFWRLNVQQIMELKSGLLDTAASLLMPEGLSEFALAVRASLLKYSNGTTLADPLDRLRNCLSALEGVLLKHEIEPRAHSVANRMSFLLAREGDDRESVKQLVRQIYWLQGQSQLAALSRREEALIALFTSHAYDVLYLTLGNTITFGSKVQFLIEVDRLGLPTQ